MAFRRHAEAADRARRLDPGSAIQHLAVASALLSGVAARGADERFARTIEELVIPLRPLSPALDVVCDLVVVAAKVTRGHDARDLRVKVAEQTAVPVSGIDEVSRAGIHALSLYYLALEDTVGGLAVPEEQIAPVEASAAYTPLALQLRMLRAYYRGDEKGAETYRRRRDAAMTGRVEVDGHLETSVLYESSAYTALGNLIALKRLVPVIEERARSLPGWGPHRPLAAGNCHFLRGDHDRAIDEYESGLALEGTESHAGRVLLTIRLVAALTAPGRGAEAKGRGEHALRRYRNEPLIPLYLDQLELALAGAEAVSDESDAALARARAVLTRAEARGVGGLVLANLLTDSRARRATCGNTGAFEMLTRRVGELAARVESTAPVKQHARLLALRQAAHSEPVLPSVGGAAPTTTVYSELALGVRTQLEQCRGETERTRRALDILVRHAGASGGFLYVCRAAGLECVVQIPDTEPPQALEDRVSDWARVAFASTGDATATASFDDVCSKNTSPFSFVELVGAAEGELTLVGVAALLKPGGKLASVSSDVVAAVTEQLVQAGDAVSKRLANT